MGLYLLTKVYLLNHWVVAERIEWLLTTPEIFGSKFIIITSMKVCNHLYFIERTKTIKKRSGFEILNTILSVRRSLISFKPHTIRRVFSMWTFNSIIGWANSWQQTFYMRLSKIRNININLINENIHFFLLL